MAKTPNTKGKPRLGRGPISRAGAGIKATTKTPGRHLGPVAPVSKNGQRGRKRLGSGPITAGGSK